MCMCVYVVCVCRYVVFMCVWVGRYVVYVCVCCVFVCVGMLCVLYFLDYKPRLLFRSRCELSFLTATV